MSYPGRLEENVAAFARILRSEGMRAGPREVGDALTALQRFGTTDRGDFFHVLRTLFAGSPREIERFDPPVQKVLSGWITGWERASRTGNGRK